jgi:hypothetical protein
VVVARKPWGTVPPHVLQLLGRPELPELGFVATDHLLWTSEPGNVTYAGWTGPVQIESMGAPWHATNVGLTAFTGLMWPKGGMWNDSEPWARQLHTHWQQRPIKSETQELDGLYTAVSLSTTGEGHLTTDPLSVAMLYRAETPDFVVYSSRASLAARVAAPEGQEPERDPFGVGWLTFFGYVVSNQTGFANTVVLPAGATVDIHPNWGSRVHVSNAPPWAGNFTQGLSDDDLVGLVYDDLTRSIRSTGLLPTRDHLADITGGKDSRLILALMIEAGVTDKFKFRTIGAPHSADAIVGEAIASNFSLEHEAVDPQPMDPALFRRRLGTHVFQTCGVLNAWDMKGGIGVSTSPRVSGLGGEVLRTFFSDFPVMSRPQEIHTEYHGRTDRLELLHPDVRADYQRMLNAEVTERLDSGGSTPQDMLDAFYIRARLRRWFGTGEELGEAFRVVPLYSLRAVQAAFALGPVRRRDELLHFEITRRACDKLARMPFANASWTEGAVQGQPDPDEYRPPPQKATSAGTVEWQASRLEVHRDVIEAYLLDDPSNPVFEVVNREAVEKVLTGPSVTDSVGLRSLYGALTAAVWLGHHETPARSGEPPKR